MTPRPGLRYEWDEDKSQTNLQIRGFGFDLIHRFDWNTAATQQDLRNVDGERWISIGLIGDRLYVAVWTQRGTATRIISLRKANNREADRYERARS
jgi:uncharacterized DUF497 family protein